MIAIEDRDLASRLWLRARDAGFSDELLPAAMKRAFALGLDAEGQHIFAALQHSASSATAAFRQVDLQQVIAMQQARNEAFANMYRAYTAGDIPLAMLAASTGTSIAEIYDVQFAESRKTATGDIAPLYIRHGGRMLSSHLSLSGVQTLTVDVSTLLLSDLLGVLDQIEKRFVTLRISPATCTALAEQQDRLQPVQATIDAANAQLVSLVDDKHVSEVPAATPSGAIAALVPRVDAEWAATMQAAIDDGGYMVDDGALLETQTEAEGELLKELRDRLRVPTTVDSLPSNTKLYLSASAALDLAHSGRLATLAKEFRVFVEARAISRARAAQATRTRRDALTARLARLSERIAGGLADGKYQTFVPAPREPGATASDLSVGALFDLSGTTAIPQHAFGIDDRLASSQLMMAGSPVATLQNLLVELRSSDHLSDAETFAILLRLRQANCRFLDLETDEIVHWLAKANIVDGIVQETEALKILRVYLNAALSDRNLRVAPLPQTDPNGRAIGEGAFAMNSALAVTRALGEVWSLPNVSTGDRMAHSDWLLRNLYTGTYGVHHLYGGFLEPQRLMALDMANLLTSVAPVLDGETFDLERGAAFIEWLDGRIVTDRLTTAPGLLGDTVAEVKKSFTSIALEHDVAGRMLVRAVYSQLPERIKIAAASDAEFVEKVDLRPRPSIRIAGFEFGEEEFWAAIDALRTKTEVTMQSHAGEEVRLGHAPVNRPKGVVFSSGAEERLFADETFWSLAFDGCEQQREHLRQHPEIFDLPGAMLGDAIEELITRPTAQERLKRLQDLKEQSASSFYTSLRDSLGNEEISIEDFVPPVAALLRHYLPGYVIGGALDCGEAFGPLLDRADLLDLIRRSAVMPVALPDKLVVRFRDQPETKRRAILDSLAAEAASPVAHAQVAILGFTGGSDTERDLAFAQVDKLCGEGDSTDLELFLRTLTWVYWRLSFEQELASDVRLLLAWAHSARLAGLFRGSGIDRRLFNELFIAQGHTVTDDVWTRTEPFHDVLHPLTANEVVVPCAAAAHVVMSITAERDAAEVARRLDRVISAEAKRFVIPLMRDLSLATNINGSFMAIDIATVLQSIDSEASEHFGREAKASIVSDSMLRIDSGDDAVLSWRAIAAIIGHLPPPADVRSWIKKKVTDSAEEHLAARKDALDAVSVLAEWQTYFDDAYRQRVEDITAAGIAQWQKGDDNQPTAVELDSQRWTNAGVALAARPGSREATGAALGRVLQRLVEAAPTIAPTARAMLTMLPFRLPMEYLPALWPIVITTRAAAG